MYKKRLQDKVKSRMNFFNQLTDIRLKIKVNDRVVKIVEKVPSSSSDFILEELIANTKNIDSYSYNEEGVLINKN